MSAMYPLEMVLLFAGPGYAIMVILMFVLLDLRKTAPEAFVLRKARNKNLPVMEYTSIGSENAMYVIGTKDEDGDIVFEDRTYGIKVDPGSSLSKTSPSRHRDGLNIYHFSTTSYLPLSPTTAKGLCDVEDELKKPEYSVLSFLTAEEAVQLIDTPREERRHDIGIFIKMYKPKRQLAEDGIPVSQDRVLAQVAAKLRDDHRFVRLRDIPEDEVFAAMEEPEDEIPRIAARWVQDYCPVLPDDGVSGPVPVTAEVLAGKIETLQDFYQDVTRTVPVTDTEVYRKLIELEEALGRKPMRDGFFSYAAAFKLNPNVTSSQDLQHFELQLYRKIYKLLERGMTLWNNPYLWAIALIMAGSIGFFIVVQSII